MDHGAAGYGVFFMLLERCGESANYSSAKELKLIAFDLSVDQEIIRSVIEDYNLFKTTEDGKRFFSDSFLERMAMMNKHSVNGIKGNLFQHGHATRERLDKMTDEEIIALNEEVKNSGARSRANRSKVKERKELKEVKEREKSNDSDLSLSSAHILTYLKSKFPEQYEKRINGPYGSMIRDKDAFIMKVDYKIKNEFSKNKLKDDSESLFNRLENFCQSWISIEKGASKPIIGGSSSDDVDRIYGIKPPLNKRGSI